MSTVETAPVVPAHDWYTRRSPEEWGALWKRRREAYAALRVGRVWAPGARPLAPERAGCWLSTLSPEYAAKAWEKIAAAVRAGELGPVAALWKFRQGPRPLAAAAVWLIDLEDKADVAHIRAVMRERLGFVHPLGAYRADGRIRYRDPGATDLALTAEVRLPMRAERDRGGR